MPDIVERLRMYARQFEDQHAPQNLTTGMREAAAEIERLRALDGHDVYAAAREEYRKKIAEQAAEIERLRAALELFCV